MSRVSSNPHPVKSWPLVYAGVALTAMATLLLELSLTRLFSVLFYYHFAFLAISIALFGLGVGGVLSYVIKGKGEDLHRRLGQMAIGNAVVVPLALLFLLNGGGGELSNLTLALIYFVSAVPFVLAGAILSLAVSSTIERVDRVYFFDLLGAAGGCLALIPLLNFTGGPNTVLVIAVLFAVTASFWYNLAGSRKGRGTAVILALAIAGLMFLNIRVPFLDVRYAKGRPIGTEYWSKWNSFSRIAVTPEPGSGRQQIVIDGDASTGIANFDIDHLSDQTRHNLLYEGPGIVYTIRPGAKTLVIGPGGGWDVSRALASGSKDITGVEINPIIAETIMKQRFAGVSRRLYHRPDVHIYVEDGRSFLQRSDARYDVIQATLVDTWASTAAGAFALSENNLYTQEAFYHYLRNLSDRGVLSFTRWGFTVPRESLRLLTLADWALQQLGEKDLARHVIIGREGGKDALAGWGARDTVLISRKPFTDADVQQAREAFREARMTAVYLPGDGPRNEFGQYLLSENKQQFLDRYPFDVTAVGDNRPFFFYTVQPRDLWAFLTSSQQDSADYKINKAVPLLFGLVAISLLATVIVLVLPPLVLGTRLPTQPGVRSFLLYFACIGIGYILVQVALIQRFVLFLGQPTYALTVIIFSMLVSSGLGSLFSVRIVSSQRGRWLGVLAGVMVLVAVLSVVAPAVVNGAITLPLPVKMLIATLLIAPLGFLMGMPFPLALHRLEAWHSPSVRWAWSINAASSVLGSALAIFLAIYLGLQQTMLCGALLYGGALLLLLRSRTEAAPVPDPEPAMASNR